MIDPVYESLFRVYAPEECGGDGYPLEWHGLHDGDPVAIKNLVRAEAGNRCIRCGHPYTKGDGEWSACDSDCTHLGEVRIREVWREDEWSIHDLNVVGCSAGESIYDEGPNGPMVRYAVEAHWRILTVHHLNGVKADCRWWNLVSLCQRCHLRVQRVVLMERVWPWEHSEWFKPYVAGYYAHVYLGEDVTREQAIARMDDLLALERVA